MVRDRYGMAMTISRSGADAYDRGLRLAQCYDPSHLDAFADAAAQDPRACLPPLAIALFGVGTPEVDVGARLQEAETRATRASPRELALVRLARRWLETGVLGVEAEARRHLRRWPRDVLALSMLVPGLSWSGRPGAAEAMLDLVDELAPAFGDDWWMLGLRAFGQQERGRYEEAFALAARSLELEPRSIPAAHARTHVHYETGDHDAGHAWLTRWCADMSPSSGYYSHLSWHLALHELANGDLDSVLLRFARDMAPGPATRPLRAVLIDGASLAWRCRLRDVPQAHLPGAPVLEAVAGTMHSLPNVFLGVHAVLAAAAAEDESALAALAASADRSPVPFVTDLVRPLADALRAYVEGRYADAADGLAALIGSSDRLGGSHAQREVVEDTLLASMLRAGRQDQACAVLLARLDRRPSPYDERLLARLPREETAKEVGVRSIPSDA